VSYFHWLAQTGATGRTAPLLSTGFGLVHGVGFAGILLEIDIGRAQLLPSLLGFNLGVEAGQLAVILAVLCAREAFSLFTPERALYWGRAATVAGLSGLGSFWFLGRAFGF